MHLTTQLPKYRLVRALAVLLAATFALALAAPAFGGPNVATTVAKALKLSKAADKRSKAAEAVAKQAEARSQEALTAATTSPKDGLQGPAGPKGDPGPQGEPGPAGDPGTLSRSFFAWGGDPILLSDDYPVNSQVNLMTPSATSGGVLKTTAPGQLHIQASVEITKTAASASGDANCFLRVSGEGISFRRVSFPDESQAPGPEFVTISLVGAKELPAGTYNIGVLCATDKPNTAYLTHADLTAVVYAR